MDRRNGTLTATSLMVWLAAYPASSLALRAQTAAAALTARIVNDQQRDPPIKFKLREQYEIVVQGSIGRLEHLNLLIDTGSTPTLVDLRVARKLHLQVQPGEIVAFGMKTRNLWTTLPEVRIGSLRVPAMSAGVGDLSFAEGVDAVVGLDVLTRASFRIDYGARELIFGPPAPREQAARLEFTPPFLTVPVTIGGRPVRLLVDTGSRHLILFERRVRGRLAYFPRPGEKVLYHVSGASRLRRVSLPEVGIGGTAIRRLEALLCDAPVDIYPPGIDGVLGVKAIASRHAQFDFERNLFGFE